VAALALPAGAALLVGLRDNLADAEEQLRAAHARATRQAFRETTVRALCLVNTTTDQAGHLRKGQGACRRALALYHVLDRDGWQQDPDWQGLDDGKRPVLAEDVRELLLLLAWAATRAAPDDTTAVRRALALLDRAQAVVGLPASRALSEDRAHYLERLGDAAEARAARDRARGIRPHGARDHFLLATAYARKGPNAGARGELDLALRLNPRH
jgi:hypothetical protein